MGKPPSQRDQGSNPPKTTVRRSKHQRRQRMLAIIGGVALGAMVLGAVAAGFVGGDSTPDTTPTSSTTSPTTVAPAVNITVPPAGQSITGDTPCPAADGSSPRTTSFENPPPTCIDPARTYRAIIDTNKGPITVLLNPEQAPGIVNSFVVLSRYHFYDGVPFVSIVPRKYLVTGDATGDPPGTGGPGYTLPDEIPEAGVIYPWGTLAAVNMEPDANGSLFLIASGEEAADLPPNYSVFGQVLDGADAVNAIDRAGNASTGQPSEDIHIERVTIIEE